MMHVNQEDYEDKLAMTNQLNREKQCLKVKLDKANHQRDTILECLTQVMEIADQVIEHESYIEQMRQLVANARAQMGQSEMM